MTVMPRCGCQGAARTRFFPVLPSGPPLWGRASRPPVSLDPVGVAYPRVLERTRVRCLASNIVCREQCCVPAHRSHRVTGNYDFPFDEMEARCSHSLEGRWFGFDRGAACCIVRRRVSLFGTAELASNGRAVSNRCWEGAPGRVRRVSGPISFEGALTGNRDKTTKPVSRRLRIRMCAQSQPSG